MIAIISDSSADTFIMHYHQSPQRGYFSLYNPYHALRYFLIRFVGDLRSIFWFRAIQCDCERFYLSPISRFLSSCLLLEIAASSCGFQREPTRSSFMMRPPVRLLGTSCSHVTRAFCAGDSFDAINTSAATPQVSCFKLSRIAWS